MLFELNPQNSHLAQEITFFIIFEQKTHFQNPEKSHFHRSKHPFPQEFTKLNASWKQVSLTWF